MVIGCLVLPLGLLGSDRSSEARGDKSAQKQAKADRHLAEKIKKEVVKDDSLPLTSRNVDVTVRNGIVTLKGVVQSDEESQAIQADAEAIVINDMPVELINSREAEVENQLVVKAL
jgi:hypothetical protein